jgi:glutamyl/glutaminyl-tRNA synthetase
LKKIFQIDEKDNFEVSFIRSLNLLKIDYDSNISYNKRRKDEYNQKAKLLIIRENGQLYLAVPDPEVDDEYRKIEIKQKQFDIIKRLLEKR